MAWTPMAENARDHERRFRRWLTSRPKERKRIEELCFEAAAGWRNGGHK